MPVLSYTPIHRAPMYRSSVRICNCCLKNWGLPWASPSAVCLAWLMIALLEKTRAHLFRLAEKLPDDETTDMARLRRIRRFLSNGRIDVTIFTPALLATELVGLCFLTSAFVINAQNYNSNERASTHIWEISESLCQPRQRVVTPGTPSCFRPRKPPS